MSTYGEDGITSRFQMKDLPTEIAREVENMKVGDISNAFRMISRKNNKTVVAVIKLKNRIEGKYYRNSLQAALYQAREEKPYCYSYGH